MMAGYWLPTIHVESNLNPGIPDLSYVIPSHNCDTGWLELKAVEPASVLRITVEPSQHQWMKAHCTHVPAHFLIQVGQKMYLIEGKHHSRFLESVPPAELPKISIVATDVVNRNALFFGLKLISSRSRYDAAREL